MRVPKLCNHKPSGRAYVRVNRKCHYLGPWGHPDTDAEYNRFVVNLMNGELPDAPTKQGITVKHVATMYLEHAESYYGADSSDIPGVRAMVKWVCDVTGNVTCQAFGPRMLKRVRDAMIEAGCTRGYINQQHGRIVAMMSWGVESELIPAGVPQALREVKKLAKGRTAAKEGKLVTPPPDEHILAALEVMPDAVAALVQLQLLMACRPGELWTMRPCDVDREAWTYTPSRHKTQWKGKNRVITIGPMAQDILRPYLLRADSELCFRSLTGEPWNRHSFRREIHAACKRANVPCWNPYQLRHFAATEIRQLFDLESVQSRLGHANRATSERYASAVAERDAQVASRIG